MALELIKTTENSRIRENFERFFRGILQKRTEKTTKDMESDEVAELIYLLKTTKDAWKCCTMNYEFMTENEMIDYYTYQIKSYELKFEYLIKKAKEMGIKAAIFRGL